MRTDSVRISEVARSAAKKHIEKTYGKEYYENRYYKTKADSQDAHEAIRPSYIELTPDTIKDNLTPDQYKLYRLIYNRFIASQMANAVYDTISVSIDANDYNFKSNGQKLKFKGFIAVYVETEEDDGEQIPDLKERRRGKKRKIRCKTKLYGTTTKIYGSKPSKSARGKRNRKTKYLFSNYYYYYR